MDIFRGTAAADSANICLSCPSVKMTNTAAGEVIYRQQVSLEAGKALTLSAYAKTSALNGSAFLRIRPVSSGAFTAAVSEVLTGSTDAAVGNEQPTDGWESVRVTLNPLNDAA